MSCSWSEPVHLVHRASPALHGLASPHPCLGMCVSQLAWEATVHRAAGEVTSLPCSDNDPE